METLAGSLAREISRVTALREQYCETQRLCGAGVNCAPAISIITAALDAADCGDVVQQMTALNELRKFAS